MTVIHKNFELSCKAKCHLYSVDGESVDGSISSAAGLAVFFEGPFKETLIVKETGVHAFKLPSTRLSPDSVMTQVTEAVTLFNKDINTHEMSNLSLTYKKEVLLAQISRFDRDIESLAQQKLKLSKKLVDLG